jgi:hypothetical protein
MTATARKTIVAFPGHSCISCAFEALSVRRRKGAAATDLAQVPAMAERDGASERAVSQLCS